MRRLFLVSPALAALLALACNSDGSATSGGGVAGAGATAGSTATGGTGGQAGAAVTGGEGGLFAGSGGATTTSTPTGPVSLEEAGISPDSLPPLPRIACDPAGDASECTLPASVCASAEWLVYYANPKCDAGVCAWEPLALACQAPDACIDGGCEYNFTL